MVGLTQETEAEILIGVMPSKALAAWRNQNVSLSYEIPHEAQLPLFLCGFVQTDARSRLPSRTQHSGSRRDDSFRAVIDEPVPLQAV
jgi:hypothetical protein